MMHSSRAQILRIIERVYAITALFALTQGPVMRLWSPSAALVGELPDPSVPHVYFATYVVVQMPALALWSRRVDPSWWRTRQAQALLALVTWLGLTVVWSTYARHSLVEFVALMLTTIFGLYLAESFTVRQFWTIVLAGTGLGVGFSWVAVMRLWDGAVNFQEDYWVGIYFNRNSLAPVSAIAIIGALWLITYLLAGDKKPRKLSIGIGLCFSTVVIVLSAIELWNSKSRTSPAALLTAFLTCLLFAVLVSSIGGHIRNPRVQSNLTTIALFTSVSAVLFVIRLRTEIGPADVVTTAFNQRSGLWSLSWLGILDKPWHGWGWMSAWRTPAFFLSGQDQLQMTWDSQWSHSGYFDLLLGGGISAGVLFGVYLWFGSQRDTGENVLTSVQRLFLPVFVLVAATQESFFVGSHFMWALLVASLSTKKTQRSIS